MASILQSMTLQGSFCQCHPSPICSLLNGIRNFKIFQKEMPQNNQKPMVCFDVFRLADPKSRFFSKTINFLTKVNDVIWNRHVIQQLMIWLKFVFEQFLFPRDLEKILEIGILKIFLNLNQNLISDVKFSADSKFCHLPISKS